MRAIATPSWSVGDRLVTAAARSRNSRAAGSAPAAAFDGQIGRAAYSASKGVVVGMTLPLACDLADKHIRVMTLAPELFATSMLAGMPQEAQDSLDRQVPHPLRLGEPASSPRLVRHIGENPKLNAKSVGPTAPTAWPR